MTVDAIRVVLGRLQDDPDSETAWAELSDIVTSPSDKPGPEALRVLEQARARHESRREWRGVARILEMELALSEDAAMQGELGRVLDEELLDADKALAAYSRLIELLPEGELAQRAENFIEQDEARRSKWRELHERFLSEAEGAADDGLRAGLLASAADIAHRYGAGELAAQVAELAMRAITLEPKVKRGLALASATLSGAPADEAKALDLIATRGQSKDDRIAAGLRAGRIRHKLGERDLAITSYERVLDLSPGQPDALAYLAEAYTETEQWDHLVALYEDQLKSGARGEAELGVLLQIGMVHWRMRKTPEAAEPYFERVRRYDPTQGVMLSFFRELATLRDDSTKLVQILTDAQRASNDPAQKKELAGEIAKLAEAQDNAQKAIEQYKALLKVDPNDAEARAALKRIYGQSESWPALVDLLKHELDRIPAANVAERAAALKEIASIYRDHVKNEQAFVQVLTQLSQLDEADEEPLRELVGIYETLGRFRDLLTCQQRLAEVTKDDDEKAELYRAVARRWSEQFSNVQNAIAGYEGLFAVRPKDEEARTKLKELYSKRRSFKELYALYEIEEVDAEGPAKIELLLEMAKLAAERLDRGADAIVLQKRVLDLDPTSMGVYDALEKQAEREKDFASVAEVLERRASVTTDNGTRLAILQKLGTVYSDRLKDAARATDTWKRVLELSPGHAKALRVLREAYVAGGDFDGLEALYASQGDWDGLADFLSSSADKASDADQKIELSFRAAAVYETKLDAAERATRSYERILGVDGGNARAAKALAPIYEAEERWGRLPALYEILLSVADDATERVAMLRKLATLTGGPLSDKTAALGYARRAYELIPDEDNLEALEAASRAASSWGPFVDAVEARLAAAPASAGAAPATPAVPAAEGDAPKKKKKKKKGEADAAEADVPSGGASSASGTLDPKLERALRLKLANAYAKELGKIDEAVATYKRLVESDPTDAETLREFDALLRGAERKDDLRWLFELRVASATESERARIYEEWATLEEDVFANPKDAIQFYRKAAELDPERGETLKSLSRLLLAENDHAGAAEIIERHRDLSSGSDRAQREVEIAYLYIDHLGRPADALNAAERALELLPRDADAIAILARLVDVPETRARAATVLSGAYAELGDGRREGQMLRVMIETEADIARRRELHSLLADVEEKKLSSPGNAFDVVLRTLNELADDMILWDRAHELAQKAGRPTDLAEAYRAHIIAADPEHRTLSADVELELCDRAATLHDEQLGDADGALPYLKRILAMEPHNDKAFDRLKQILTAAERWGELEDLFNQAAESAEEPAQKIALLTEVAMIAEEVIGLPQKAIGYHERILSIDPLSVPSLDALEKLYEDEERFGDLAALLERRLETAVDDEAVDIRLYLGRLYLEQLLVPDRALAHVEEILTGRPDDPDARELAERMLEIGSLKHRTAVLLERVYEEKGETRSLVKMLEIRLEASCDAEEQITLLRTIGELRDERLHDDPGAFESLARLAPRVPDDEGVRTRLVEIGRRLNLSEQVATVLGAAADAAKDSSTKVDILMQVAGILEGSVGDRARAEEVYRKVLGVDPEDAAITAPAARALARLQAESGDHAALAETLEVEAKLEESIDARKAIYERLGDLYESMLDDRKKAIHSWKARLDDDVADEKALGALERLYEAEKMYPELVSVLQKREEVAEDADERRRVMVKAAETLAGPIADVPLATQAWRAVVDSFGADRSAHAALAKLYETAERWPDLAEILEAELGLATEPEDRVKILVRLGAVKQRHLADLEGALDAYREALELEPGDTAARAALESMLEIPDARKQAAELLHPLYEVDGDAERLLRVLEIEAEVAETPGEKAEKLAKALATAEGPLGDVKRAYDYARRAVREAAGDESIGAQVETLERLTASTERWSDTATLYREVADDVLDSDVQLAMLLRVGELAEQRLEQPELAVEYYKKALEARPDERRAMIALEALYEKSGSSEELLDIVKKRGEVAESDEERKELFFREAELMSGKLDDRAGAIDALEAVIEVDVDPRATTELEALYQAEKRYDDLVRLYERMLESDAHAGAAGAPVRVKIAAVARRELMDSPRAFDELAEALAHDPGHPAAVRELESVLAPPAEGKEPAPAEDRARAAEMLEPIYLKEAAWQKVRHTLEARLDASQDPGERIEILKRLATLQEEQLENYGAALEASAKLLHEDIADRAVWSELERLARVGSAEKRLAEIFAGELSQIDSDDPTTAELAKRTGQIFADVGDSENALQWLRRAHAFEPESEELFAAIDAILVKEGRDADRVELMRAAIDYREGDKKVALLHTVGGLLEGKLDKPNEAIEAYRAVLDVDATDAAALDRLTDLYANQGQHQELAELYEQRADQVDSAEKAAPYRLALAKLRRSKLEDVGGAIDQLEAIVLDVPWFTEAVTELESLEKEIDHRARVIEILRPLYERGNAWERIVAQNKGRLEIATDKHEKASILRETAGLLEREGDDKKAAFKALGTAFDIDPEDAEIREELERLARETKSLAGLAQALEKGASAIDDEITKRELLASLARVYDKDLDDPRAALSTYGRLADASEGDAEPLTMIDELAVLLGDWPRVTEVLERRIAEASDVEAAELLRRLARTRAEMLDDEDGAAKSYERALELEPDSTETIDRLLPLYESKDASERLVELYGRRVQLASSEENDLRYDLNVRAAQRFEGPLSNPRDAIVSLGAALEVRPGDAAVLKSLERLYRAEDLHDDLLDNLKEQAAHADTTEARSELRVRIGDLYKDKLDEPAEALSQYRLVLEEAPAASNAAKAALEAARAIAEADEDLRLEATEILLPALRAGGMHRERVAVLELRIRALTDAAPKAEALREVSDVLDGDLGEPEAALAALLRSLDETPENEALHAEIERLAAKGAAPNEGFGKYADALEKKAAQVLESAIARDLWVRAGKTAEDRLDAFERAATDYAKALEHAAGDPSEKDILASLDRLYEKLGNHRALADVLEQRLAFASDSEQADLFHRTAKLQIREFKDPPAGLGSLRQALEKDGLHAGAREELEKLTADRDLFEEVSETLESVYRQAADNKALASLFEKRIGFAELPSDRLRLRLELARVLEDQASDPKAALAALLVALADDPSDSDVLAEIERVAAMVEGWADSAKALEAAIVAHPDLSREVATDLWVRAAGWRQNKLSDQAGAEHDFEEALKHDPQNEVILRSIEQIQRSPGREADLVATLRRLARLDGISGASELRREAKSIAEHQVGDLEKAEAILREMIATDEADAWALAELTEIRRKAGDSQQVYELLVRRTEVAADGATIRSLRHEAATVARADLKDAAAATDLYEQLFEDEPTDERAQVALRELYAETGKKKELGKLLERLIDVTDDKARRSALRLEAAKVSDELDATSEAIDQLRAILDDDPSSRDAALFLSRLFEKTGRDEDLAELLTSQIKLAEETRDLEAELEYRVRLAEVQEGRLGDLEKAADTLRAIIARDANHTGALVSLARIQEKRGEKADAAVYLERLLLLQKEDESVATAKRLADLFAELKDEEGTQRALEKGLVVSDTDEEIRARLRALYERKKDWAKLAALVLVDARRATETPEQVRLLKTVADIQKTQIGDAAAAADLLKEASDLVPDDRDLLLALCDAYSESQRGKQAVEVLKKIVDSYGGRRSKDVAVIHHRLARAYLADGDRQAALAELDTAFKIDPGAISVLRDLGVLALELADTDTDQKDAYVDRAGKTFKALLLQRLDDGAPITKSEVFYYLADVARRQGDTKRAMQMCERALDNDKNFERAKELLAKLKG